MREDTKGPVAWGSAGSASPESLAPCPGHAGEMLFFARDGLKQPAAACCQHRFQACIAKWMMFPHILRERGEPGVQVGTFLPREPLPGFMLCKYAGLQKGKASPGHPCPSSPPCCQPQGQSTPGNPRQRGAWPWPDVSITHLSMIYRRCEVLFVLPGLPSGPSQGQRSARRGDRRTPRGGEGPGARAVPVGTRQEQSRAPSQPAGTTGSSRASLLPPCSRIPGQSGMFT